MLEFNIGRQYEKTGSEYEKIGRQHGKTGRVTGILEAGLLE